VKKLTPTPILDRPQQSVRRNDCGVIFFGGVKKNDGARNAIVGAQSEIALPVFDAGENDPPAWGHQALQTFLKDRTWRQFIVVGDLGSSNMVSTCLYGLEQGFEVYFCVPVNSPDDRDCLASIIRLTHSGAIPIPLKQLCAELAYDVDEIR